MGYRKCRFTAQKGQSFRPGVFGSPEGATFCIALPEEATVTLILASKKGKRLFSCNMREGARIGALCSVFIKGRGLPGLTYRYVEGEDLIQDPCAMQIAGGKSLIPPAAETVAPFRLSLHPRDRILYKLHVKGFTKLEETLPESIRGTFAGLSKKIPYLKALGITSVLLMPCYTFAPRLTNGKVNYWGFSSENAYFSPNERYAFSPGNSTNEVRAMISAMHEAGLECMMEFYFPAGTPTNLAIYALQYWHFSMGMDGFRLYADGRLLREILQDPTLYDTVLILEDHPEAYGISHSFHKKEALLVLQHAFSDDARSLLIGRESVAARFASPFHAIPYDSCYVNYITDHNGFTLADLVSYNEKHNEENEEGGIDGISENRSWNCGEEGISRNPKVLSLREQQIKNALALLLLGQGIPLLYGGDERGNTQDGNNNGYALDNPKGWISWEACAPKEELTSFVKSLISIRKKFGILRAEGPLGGKDFAGTGIPDAVVFGANLFEPPKEPPIFCVLYNGQYAARNREEGALLILFNSTHDKMLLPLPKARGWNLWQIILSSDKTQPAGEYEKESILAPPHTITIAIGIRDESATKTGKNSIS